MNLFWKRLFGQLQSTSKYEAIENETIESMHRYDEVEKSVELAEYRQLFHLVKSAKFQENKKILQNRKYKDTEEYRNWQKSEKLSRKTDIKLYYSVLHSEELKIYLAFKETPEFEELGNPQKVKVSEQLKKLKAFEKSKAYKTYVRFHNSYIIKELEELKEKISTPEFKQANEFWANPKRWTGTPEYASEQRFYTLAKNPDIAFYNAEKPERFKPYRNLKLAFSSEFEQNTLNKKQWQFGFHYPSIQLIGNHSFANEKQANNNGKNTIVEDGLLKILTKSEHIKASAWDVTKGFIEIEFDYTADVLQTADAFRQKQGVFHAKIRCSGALHHALWLGADKKLPHINIFHFDGKNITLGNANKDLYDGITIKGITHSTPYVYTLFWNEKELIWKINNLEVYRTSANVPKEEMYLAINSFISAKQNGATGSFEVDWIRVYSETK
jgi:hypothetical protein